MTFILHHTSVLVADIRKSASEYMNRFGYRLVSRVLHEPAQTAYVQFLLLPGLTSYLELVTPDREGSVLSNALKKLGGGWNHFCYAVDDIELSCACLVKKKMQMLKNPMLSDVFPGRRTAWMIGYDAIPVELVETGIDDWEAPEVDIGVSMDKKVFLGYMEEILNIEEGSLSGSESLAGISSWDSLSVLAVIAMADDQAEIFLNIEEFEKVKTIDDIYSLFTRV